MAFSRYRFRWGLLTFALGSLALVSLVQVVSASEPSSTDSSSQGEPYGRADRWPDLDCKTSTFIVRTHVEFGPDSEGGPTEPMQAARAFLEWRHPKLSDAAIREEASTTDRAKYAHESAGKRDMQLLVSHRGDSWAVTDFAACSDTFGE